MMKKITIVFAILLIGTSVFAQGKKKYNYGLDSINCVKNLFLFQEFSKQKAYTDAIGPWEKAVEMCPGSRKSLYTKGSKMLKALMKEEKDEVKKKELFDKLMAMYDTRIAAFGQEGFVLGLKGVDFYKNNKENHFEAMEILKKSMDISGNKAKASAISYYFKAIYKSHKEDPTKVPVDVVLSEYLRMSDVVSHNISKLDASDPKQKKKMDAYVTAKDNIDSYFIKVAKCEDIIRLYKEKITASPDDMELKAKALSVMNKKDCVDNDLFFPTAKAVHESSPTYKSASALAKYLLKQNKVNEALNYFDEAVTLCGDCSDKLTLITNAGLTAVSKGKISKANKYANLMLKMNPNSGSAYLIKGDAARTSKCPDDKLNGNSIYWLAADYYSKAKSVDSSEKIQKAANKKLASCRRRYPTKEELFFIGLKAGDSYTLCNGSKTTIRKSN